MGLSPHAIRVYHYMMEKNLVILGAWYFSDVVAELAAEQGWNLLGRVDPGLPVRL